MLQREKYVGKICESSKNSKKFDKFVKWWYLMGRISKRIFGFMFWEVYRYDRYSKMVQRKERFRIYLQR